MFDLHAATVEKRTTVVGVTILPAQLLLLPVEPLLLLSATTTAIATKHPPWRWQAANN